MHVIRELSFKLIYPHTSMDTITRVAVVDIVMNVFSGNFGAKVKATYVEQNRKNALGVVAGSEHDVTIIVTESFTNAWQSEMISQTSDILVYAYPDTVLANKTCVGGTIKFDDRTLRIESFASVKNQRTGVVEQIELGCSEL